MIQEVIEYLTSVLNATGLFSRSVGLAVLVKKGDAVIPAYRSGKMGNYKYVDLLTGKGSFYFRIVGQKNTNFETDDTGCGDTVKDTTRVRLVYSTRAKDLVNYCDTQYSESWVNSKLVTVLMQKNIRSLTLSLGADIVGINNIVSELDGKDVWRDEFSGIDWKGGGEYVVGSIDFDVEITGELSCFVNYSCEKQKPYSNAI